MTGFPVGRAIIDAPSNPEETTMAQENKRGSREAKKPKKTVPKTNAAAPSTKDMVSSAVKAAKK